jgi:hypothetical protein
MIKDWVLVTWAERANSGELVDMELTFQSGGLLCCGTLISGREYFERIQAMVTAGMAQAQRTEEAIRSVSALYQEHAAHYARRQERGAWTEHPATSPEESSGADFIHFKDVNVLFGQTTAQIPAFAIPLWRTKIASIDGFVLGGSIAQLPRSQTNGEMEQG